MWRNLQGLDTVLGIVFVDVKIHWQAGDYHTRACMLYVEAMVHGGRIDETVAILAEGKGMVYL